MIQILSLQTIFLQSIDAFITYGALSKGLAEETNSIMFNVISNGWHYFFLVKIVGTILIFIILYDIKREDVRLSTLISINLIYILIFAYNLSQLSMVI